MLKCLKKIDKKATGLVAAGVLLGTAGVKLLGSKDAKKLYTNCTAAVLRAKDCVMKTGTDPDPGGLLPLPSSVERGGLDKRLHNVHNGYNLSVHWLRLRPSSSQGWKNWSW